MDENKIIRKLFAGVISAIEEILRRSKKKLDFSDEELEQGSPKRCVVGIDFDNISSLLRVGGKEFDFPGFVNELLKIGFSIDALKVFIPFNSYYNIPANANNLGYEIVVCQKIDDIANVGEREKREDKVDSYMFMSLRNFLEYEGITHVVIATHDKHSIELVSEAVKKGKKVVFFGERGKMNFRLVDVINQFGIPVYPLPVKEKKYF